MNSSSLFNKSNPSQVLKKSSVKLPSIDTNNILQYSNDYQNYSNYDNYEEKFDQYRKIKQQPNNITIKNSIKNINPWNSYQIQKQQNKQQKINDEDIFWKSKVTNVPTNPYSILISQLFLVEHDQRKQYDNKTNDQIQYQIKEMRKQILDINTRLNSMLDGYNLAKNQFVSKETLSDSKPEFYEIQIQTNRKIEQAQIQQLKKVNFCQKIQLKTKQEEIKDKDLLLDLQQMINQITQVLHLKQKQEHDWRLKIHKTDRKLDDIIRVNNNNADNNLVKILKLQIVYYLRKQNHLKTHQEQLDHEMKLINQNDKNLQRKITKMKQSGFYKYLDENYEKMTKKYQSLAEKKINVIKNKQTVKKSFEIMEEKIARDMLKIIDEIDHVLKPNIKSYKQHNDQLCQKINKLVQKNEFSEKSNKNINFFLTQESIESSKNIQNLKPKFRLNLSKLSNYQTLNLQHQVGTQKSSTTRNQILKEIKKQKSFSNSKITRYNDKNVTIDVINDEQPENLLNSSPLKPKAIRNFSSRLAKPSINKSMLIQKQQKSYKGQISHSLLKPRLFGMSKPFKI